MRPTLLCLAASAGLFAVSAQGFAQPAPAATPPAAPGTTTPGTATPGTATPGTATPGAAPTPPPGAAQAAAPRTAPEPAQAAPNAAANPVIARVGNEEIYRSDLADAMQLLPEQLRNVPPNVLFPMLLDQLIDRKVIAIAARKAGLAEDPEVKRQMARAADQVLQTALLQREVGPKLTDEAIRARYDDTVAKKPGEEEVHARHILVADEALAKKITEELSKGGEFAELAKKYSTDPSAKAGGGDLGFFKKGDMVAEFANAAFALKAGEVTKEPVKTRFGWHIIKLMERRTAPPEPFEQARAEIRQEIIQDEVKKVLDGARAGLAIQRFNPDGTAQRATDQAVPPPAPAPAPGAPR